MKTAIFAVLSTGLIMSAQAYAQRTVIRHPLGSLQSACRQDIAALTSASPVSTELFGYQNSDICMDMADGSQCTCFSVLATQEGGHTRTPQWISVDASCSTKAEMASGAILSCDRQKQLFRSDVQ